MRQWGQDLVPLPQLKIAAWAVWKAPGPVGGGSSRASAWGGEEGGPAGNACALPTPPAKSGVSGHSPLESPRGALGPTQGRNLLIPQAGPGPADPSWAWAGLLPWTQGGQDEGSPFSLSHSLHRWPELSDPPFSPFAVPTRITVTEGCLQGQGRASTSVCPSPGCLLSRSRVLPKGGLFRQQAQ